MFNAPFEKTQFRKVKIIKHNWISTRICKEFDEESVLKRIKKGILFYKCLESRGNRIRKVFDPLKFSTSEIPQLEAPQKCGYVKRVIQFDPKTQ